MKIAIIGSRNFADIARIDKFVSWLTKDCVVVSGGARGVDKLAELAAKKYGLPTKIFYADWDTYGKSAGFRRNGTIVEFADVVVAFWDGASKGTQDSIEKAGKLGRDVFVYPKESTFFLKYPKCLLEEEGTQ